jgi:Protein adenylyltransferase SelO
VPAPTIRIDNKLKLRHRFQFDLIIFDLLRGAGDRIYGAGMFVPQLGDGRANLLGEVIGRDGVRYELQLKGSGPPPFSRGGDGRATLGPVLREYIVSEAMAALGVPTEPLTASTASNAASTRGAGKAARVGTCGHTSLRSHLRRPPQRPDISALKGAKLCSPMQVVDNSKLRYHFMIAGGD